MRHAATPATLRPRPLPVRATPLRPSPRATPPRRTRVAALSGDDTGLATALAAAPKEAWIALGSILAGLGAVVASAFASDSGDAPSSQAASAGDAPPPPPSVRDGVVVFGASGKTGRAVVAALLASGRDVVAAVRDEGRALAALAEVGVAGAGRQASGATLIISPGVDVTSPATIDPASAASTLWTGVSQAVLALGPVVGRTEGGGMAYLDGNSPEAVDARGVAAVAAALAAALPPPPVADVLAPPAPVVLPMATGPDLDAWERLDDVIMGGKSESTLEVAGGGGGGEGGGTGALWSGVMRYEGGGFCGYRTRPGLALDLTPYDGLALRVLGDGQTFKLNVKTAAQVDVPEAVYQALVPTVAGDWTTVRVPWTDFVPTRRARFDPDAPPLDAGSVRQVGLVLSRFEFDGAPNPRCKPGPWSLEIDGGIRGFTLPRPTAILLTSASVERNARIGDDAAARAADIPIVRLNPGAALNWKYEGETALRRAGVPYAVVRMTGLTSEGTDTLFPLELHQGDVVTGTVSRAEVARLVAASMTNPAAAFKTVELRRGPPADAGRLGAGTAGEVDRLWRACVVDSLRPTRGIPPLPAPVPPPPPPSEEETQAVLADPRVAAAAAAGRGGRVREEAEAAAAASAVPVEAARAAAAGAGGGGDDTAAAAADAADDKQGAAPPPPPNVADAREWVRAWRARTLEKALPEESSV